MATAEICPNQIPSAPYTVSMALTLNGQPYRHVSASGKEKTLRIQVDMAQGGSDTCPLWWLDHPQLFDAEVSLFIENVRVDHLARQVKCHIPETASDEFILGGKTPLSYTKVRKMCERIRRDTEFNERITPIRFRATVLTDLYDMTKDIKQAQAAAGYTTAAMTLKHYVKGRNNKRNAVAPVDAVYGL